MDNASIAFRLLVAAAWSDEQLHPAEALLLGQYLQRLDIESEQKRQLVEYLRLRPAADASAVWLQQVQQARTNPDERQELTEALKMIVAADGRVAAEEAKLLEELYAALDVDEPQSILPRFKRWLARLTGQPT